MRRLIFAFTALFGAVLAADPYAIGDRVENLSECVWIQNGPVSVAGKNDRPSVLFFWTISYAGNKDIDRMLSLQKKFGKDVQIVAVGCDDEAKIKSFFRLKEMDFPVLSDTQLKNLNAYLRGTDTVPFCAVIDADGRLVWRGPAAQTDSPLAEIIDKKFDLDRAIRFDRFTRELTDAMQKKDYALALKLTEKELQYQPENVDLVVLAAGLLEQRLQQPELAKKKIEDTLLAYPGNFALHECRLRFLHAHHAHGEILPAVDFAIRHGGENPDSLRRLIQIEWTQRPGEISPEALLHLGKALVSVQKYPDDAERARARLLYGRILAFCGAPDLALQAAKEARPLLSDPAEIEQTDALIRHYQEIIRISRSLH
ncbi:MAG: redoxin domain-containing protein [Victivallaceae bacterium]|nr:redoxin domain-containing protein [Victivallaceae bacterium]